MQQLAKVYRYVVAVIVCVVCVIVLIRHRPDLVASPPRLLPRSGQASCWRALTTDRSSAEDITHACAPALLDQLSRHLQKMACNSSTPPPFTPPPLTTPPLTPPPLTPPPLTPPPVTPPPLTPPPLTPPPPHKEPTHRIFRDVTSDTEDNTHIVDFPAFIHQLSGHAPQLVSTNKTNIPIFSSHHHVIPNVVHYVWYGLPLQMNFLNFLSLLSVGKFLKPACVVIHGDSTPRGPWWQKAIQDIPNIYVVRRPKPATINGQVPRHPQHYADVARLEILLDYGGIYIDWDDLILKSLEPLRKYDVTLGRETPDALSNGLILARRSAAFLRIWLETYHSFQVGEWSHHSCVLPHTLHKLFPHLLHVEETSFVRPNWQETKLLFSGHYPWRQNYALHVWKRHGKVPENSTEIRRLNSTLGEAMRHVFNY